MASPHSHTSLMAASDEQELLLSTPSISQVHKLKQDKYILP